MTQKTRRWTRGVAVLAAATILAAAGGAQAQMNYGFGRNRVQYDDFHWRILTTPHFTIYYYQGMEEAVKDAARIAERSYAYLSQQLQVDFERTIPVLLYADHQDFRQTNATTSPEEGTEGVTESLKQRMIMPVLPTMEEFSHVFTHELVHAFQFEILGIGKSLNPIQWSPPLWMMEGMAEFFSLGLDSNTESWLKDVVRRDDFISLSQFETVRDQRVYRLGQALYWYLADRYGLESVRRFFKLTVQRHDWVSALQEVYGRTPKEVSEDWKAYLKTRYADAVAQSTAQDSVGTALIRHKGPVYNVNVTPSISPDGTHVAYVANVNLRDGVYIADARTGQSRQALAYGGSTGSLETIDFFESTMSWTADGRTVAFVSSGGREDVIHLVDPKTGATERMLRYKDLSINSAAISPDGSRVVFSGMMHGQRDLYIADTAGGEPRRLTNDLFSYLHPAWSPDGRRIALATDKGGPTNADRLDFRGYRLALMDPETGDLELLTYTGWKDINPVWSPDGKSLAFLSNRTGTPQIFLLDLADRSIRRVTNLVTGVSGITQTSPAISWARDTGMMAFSTFREMGWDIYTMPDPRESAVPVEAGELVEEPVPPWEGYSLGQLVTFEERPYRTRLTADYVMAGGGFATQVGLMGDLIIGFSDMLGNQMLITQLGLYGDFTHSNLGVSYYNLSRRLNWGAALFQQASQLGTLYSSFQGSTYLSVVSRGGALFGFYPLNVFNRLEGSLGFYDVTWEYLGVDIFGRIANTEELDHFNYGEASLSYVHDSAIYNYFSGPISGWRSRFSLSRTVGGLVSTTGTGDVRYYLPIRGRATVAGRTLGGALMTNQGQIFRVGGPFNVHATNWGQMQGDNLLIQNVELRTPLLPFLPLQWDWIGAAFFADAAAVWYRGGQAVWESPDFDYNTILENTIVGAVGAGVRLNLGFTTLLLDYGIPTDFQGRWGKGRLQFAIGYVY
jgi:Tol biopolymer transport system component